MIHQIKIGEAAKVDKSDYEALYVLPIEIDGVPSGILIGKKSTELGIDVLSGGDFLNTLEGETDFNAKIRDAINRCHDDR